MHGSCSKVSIVHFAPFVGKTDLHATYSCVREKNTLQLCSRRQGNNILILADLVTLDIFNGVLQGRMSTIRTDRSISDGHNVVSPSSAGYGLTLLSVHSERSAKKSIYAHVVLCCHCNDIRLTQSQSFHEKSVYTYCGEARDLRQTSNHLSFWQLGPPICSCSPCLMWPIEDCCRATIRGVV
jgi:hypothetical protein